MHLRDVLMEGFTSYTKRVKVDLPPHGLVVVTGENGSGKSSIVEAASVLMWGKTLRGEDPWVSDNALLRGTIAVGGKELVVERIRRKAKVELRFSVDGADPVAYETLTKAQAALEVLVGTWDVWRRSSVFSSSDASHFSLATDAERKRLLEAVLLDADLFDSALEACRVDLKAAKAEVMSVTSTAQVAAQELSAAQQRVADMDAALAADPPPPPAGECPATSDELFKLRLAAKAAQEEAAALRRTARTARAAVDGAAGELRAAQRQHEAIAGKSQCGTCGQRIGAAHLKQQSASVAALKDQLSKAQKEAEDSAVALEAEAEEQEDAERLFLDRWTAKSAAMKEWTAAAEQAKQHARRVSALQGTRVAAVAAVTAAEEKAAAAAERLAASSAEVAVLTACEAALGLRGIRAHVLSKALGGLELAAQRWLSRISAGALSLKLAPYTEKKTGGTSDSIKLTISGRGNGSYRSTSGGERRRVDVSLVWAIGEIAAAAVGATPGTLFADEVFDALDDQGVDNVARALAEIAERRCVVVITHSSVVADALQAASKHVQRLRVDKGSIQVY